MNRLTVKQGTLIIGLCLTIVSVFACHRETEQDKVKKAMTTIQKAVEEKDIKKVLNGLSPSYRDPQGNAYDDIKGLLLGYFFRHQRISIYITNLDISVQDASAQALFQAVLTGRGTAEAAPSVLPESLGMYAFDVLLKKESGEWKVFSAKWERIGEAGGAGQ